ncbi:hypothetical protein HY213_02225, partial [Candidatus Peregrinibacteria bacterium]|nr:hypothetical protein [Candidatus Peregrinibacteria bacterium]
HAVRRFFLIRIFLSLLRFVECRLHALQPGQVRWGRQLRSHRPRTVLERSGRLRCERVFHGLLATAVRMPGIIPEFRLERVLGIVCEFLGVFCQFLLLEYRILLLLPLAGECLLQGHLLSTAISEVSRSTIV